MSTPKASCPVGSSQCLNRGLLQPSCSAIVNCAAIMALANPQQGLGNLRDNLPSPDRNGNSDLGHCCPVKVPIPWETAVH